MKSDFQFFYFNALERNMVIIYQCSSFKTAHTIITFDYVSSILLSFIRILWYSFTDKIHIKGKYVCVMLWIFLHVTLIFSDINRVVSNYMYWYVAHVIRWQIVSARPQIFMPLQYPVCCYVKDKEKSAVFLSGCGTSGRIAFMLAVGLGLIVSKW